MKEKNGCTYLLWKIPVLGNIILKQQMGVVGNSVIERFSDLSQNSNIPEAFIAAFQYLQKNKDIQNATNPDRDLWREQQEIAWSLFGAKLDSKYEITVAMTYCIAISFLKDPTSSEKKTTQIDRTCGVITFLQHQNPDLFDATLYTVETLFEDQNRVSRIIKLAGGK